MDSPRKRVWAAIAGVLVAGAISMFLLFGGEPSGPLVRVEKSGKTNLAGINEQEEVLWTRQFDAPIRNPFLIQKSGPGTRPDAPGQTIGLAVTVTFDGGQSQLNFLDMGSGQTLWTHEPAWSVPTNALGPIQYRWTVQTDWPGQDQPVILNGIRDDMWYGFAIEAVGLSGEVLGVYHHPGPLYKYSNPQDSGEEDPVHLFFGANSSARFDRTLVPFETEHHPGCVVLLKPQEISGQAFPYSENLPEDRDWPDVPKARESAYLLISMFSPDLDSFVDQVQTHDLRSGRSGYTAVTRDGRFIVLDENLYPIKCVLSRDCPATDLYLAGEASLSPYLYIRDGVMEWVDVPVGY